MPPTPTFPQPAAVLPGEADILAAVVADLSDDTARLVYADWLDEHGDRRGKLLRDSVAAFRAGKKLPAAGKTPKPWRDLVGLSLMELLGDHGSLYARAGAILRLARPALAFESEKAPDAKLRVGASKFGGRPDLPPGTAWPALDGEPLAFLAQFNLADLCASVAGRELPAAGVLSVFTVWEEGSGNDNFPAGSWRVFHFPGPAGLARRDPPEHDWFPPCRLRFTETLTVPDVESPWNEELGFGEDEAGDNAYQEFVWDGPAGGHRLLGQPVPIQHDPLGDPTVRHLLTLNGDENTGWEWGDGGSLYFTLAGADLKAGRLDRARLDMDCA